MSGNYHSVSLNSVVCKVLEAIVKKRLMGHLTANNFLSGCQHGFVSGRSYTTNLLSTLEALMTAEGSSIDVIYINIAKAFDSVPHEQLLKEVEALEIEGDTF